jgi:hypothetical protein
VRSVELPGLAEHAVEWIHEREHTAAGGRIPLPNDQAAAAQSPYKER